MGTHSTSPMRVRIPFALLLAPLLVPGGGEALRGATLLETWTDEHPIKLSRNERAGAMALGVQGEVYLAGVGEDPADGGRIFQVLLARVDSAGQGSWLSRTRLSGGAPEVAAIALDSSGNILVASEERIDPTHTGIALLKFDPAGKLLWTLERGWVNDPQREVDFHPVGLAIGGNGIAYISGWSVISVPDQDPEEDPYVLSVTPEGKLNWEFSLDLISGYVGRAGGIAVDPDRDLPVVAVGTRRGPLAIAFNAAGHARWISYGSRLPPVSALPPVLALDRRLDRAIVAGGVEGGYWLLDFSLDGGGLFFEKLINDPFSSMSWGIPAGVAVDDRNEGDIIVSGTAFRSPDRFGFLTMKLDRDGDYLWSDRGERNHLAAGMILGPDGKIAVTGSVETGTAGSGNLEFVTMQFTRDGKRVFDTQFAGDVPGANFPVGLAASGDGGVLVGGQATNRDSGLDFAILKYGGKETEWRRILDSTDHALVHSTSVAVGPDGAASVAGTAYSQAAGSRIALLRYHPEGRLVSESFHRFPNGSEESGPQIVDAMGNTFLATHLFSGVHEAALVAKYVPPGALEWETVMESADGGSTLPQALALDDPGNLYLAMEDLPNVALWKVSPEGKNLWRAVYRGSPEDNGRYPKSTLGLCADGLGSSFLFVAIQSPTEEIHYVVLRYNAAGALDGERPIDPWQYEKVAASSLRGDGAGGVALIASLSHGGLRIDVRPDFSGANVDPIAYPGEGGAPPSALAAVGQAIRWDRNGEFLIAGFQDQALVRWRFSGDGRLLSQSRARSVAGIDPRAAVSAIGPAGEVVLSSPYDELSPGKTGLFIARFDAVSRYLRGDCNGDGKVEGVVDDAVYLIQYLFTGGEEPRCLAACDANGDGDRSAFLSDVVYLIQFNFLGGPPPPPPFPSCAGGPEAPECGEADRC